MTKVIITDHDRNQSKIFLQSEKFYNRIFSANIALRAISKYLKQNDISYYNKNSMCKLTKINEVVDITDIIVNGRLINLQSIDSENKNEIKISKASKKYDVDADLYVIVAINSNYNEAEICGFIKLSEVEKLEEPDYYIVSMSELHNMDDFEETINQLEPMNLDILDESTEKAEELFLSYLENSITEEDKDFLITKLVTNHSLRETFKTFNDFDFAFKNLVQNENLMKLDIFKDNVEKTVKEEVLLIREEEPELYEPLPINLDGPSEFEINEDLLIPQNQEILEQTEEFPEFPEEETEPPEEVLPITNEDEFAHIALINEEPPQINVAEDEISEEDSDFLDIAEQITKEEENQTPTETVTQAEPPAEDLFEFLSELSGENQQPEEEAQGLEFVPKEEEEIPQEVNGNALSDEEVEQHQSILEYEDPIVLQQLKLKERIKKAAVIIAVAGLILGVSFAGIYNIKRELDQDAQLASTPINKVKEEQSDEMPLPPAPTQDNAGVEPSPAANEEMPPPAMPGNLPKPPGADITPPPIKEARPKNINEVMAKAVTNEHNAVRISKISWEISSSLASKHEINKYLIYTGKAIKTSLSQELLFANDQTFTETIKVLVEYADSGQVVSVAMGKSSGSIEIDNIILKTVKETLSFFKMPAIRTNKPKYTATLIINL